MIELVDDVTCANTTKPTNTTIVKFVRSFRELVPGILLRTALDDSRYGTSYRPFVVVRDPTRHEIKEEKENGNRIVNSRTD